MPNRNSAPVFAIALLLFCVSPSFAQNGVLEASGYGTGANQGVALEAAKIDAVNALVMRNMKRDVVYRDLFLSEAFRNDWFGKPSYVQQGKGKWTATVPIAVDEGIADALYVGRYSTTVGALLDQADAALTDLEAMLAQGGLEESNGVLGASETSYRQAEAKANEILRYLGPVGDATFFSSQGHRKAPELKVLIDALLKSALDGIARIRESQDKLAMNQSARNVLDLIREHLKHGVVLGHGFGIAILEPFYPLNVHVYPQTAAPLTRMYLARGVPVNVPFSSSVSPVRVSAPVSPDQTYFSLSIGCPSRPPFWKKEIKATRICSRGLAPAMALRATYLADSSSRACPSPAFIFVVAEVISSSVGI